MKWKHEPRWKNDKQYYIAVYTDSATLDPNELSYWTFAIIKQDGCINLHFARNAEYSKANGYVDEERINEACDDHIHICDIDELIEKLKSLKKIAIKHFGKDWGKY